MTAIISAGSSDSGADAPLRVVPAAGNLYFLARPVLTGSRFCSETLPKTRPIGLKYLRAHLDGRDRRCGRKLGGGCHAVLSKARYSHSLLGGRLPLPAAGHSPRWPSI